MDSNFQINDIVVDIKFDKEIYGKIVSISDTRCGFTYPIKVEFTNGTIGYYTIDGRLYLGASVTLTKTSKNSKTRIKILMLQMKYDV